MGRDRQRATLDGGIGLDINRLMKRGSLVPGASTSSSVIWYDSNYGDEIAQGIISADMTGAIAGTFRITFNGWFQEFILETRERHFGGRQWYFFCPKARRICSTLWMPPGASHFAARQAWGRRVAYASQFLDETNRAHRGQAKINKKLCRVAGAMTLTIGRSLPSRNGCAGVNLQSGRSQVRSLRAHTRLRVSRVGPKIDSQDQLRTETAESEPRLRFNEINGLFKKLANIFRFKWNQPNISRGQLRRDRDPKDHYVD